jgi:hypothetical protein
MAGNQAFAKLSEQEASRMRLKLHLTRQRQGIFSSASKLKAAVVRHLSHEEWDLLTGYFQPSNTVTPKSSNGPTGPVSGKVTLCARVRCCCRKYITCIAQTV